VTSNDKKIRVLIVDDEPPARRALVRLLKDDPETEIVGTCANGREALAAAHEQTPDVIFLDVEMPGMDGFAFLEALKLCQMPFVIFVTAYDHYALKAFDVYAVDYVLKPIDEERFQRAYSRAKERLTHESRDANVRILSLLEEIRTKQESPERVLQGVRDRLFIKAEGKTFLLNVDEIDLITAEGKYVRLFVGAKSYLFREAIGNMEFQLDLKKLVRIHRSTIINIAAVKEMHPLFHGEYEVMLRNGKRLTLSRRYREKLQKIVGGSL
jgi:two-component system LytT family response regulator